MDGSSADEPQPVRTARIDTRAGHVGITVSNYEDAAGVHVDFVDPADLAAKAGLHKGAVIVAVDGSSASATDHAAFIEALDAATTRGAVLELEYLTAAAAAAQAAERATKRTKSIFVAYLLWLCAGWTGVHHFYLGRDEHCLLHVASANGVLGLGWLRDLFCIPRYVRAANEDASHARALAAAKAAHPERPPRGFARSLAMIFFGAALANLLSCAPPSAEEAPWPAELTYALETALQVLGATVAVSLVGRIAPHEGSFRLAVSRAFYGRLLGSLVFGATGSFYVAFGAAWGWRSSARWQPAGAPQRRLTVSVRRRAGVVILGLSLLSAANVVALYQRGAVTVGTGDGGFQHVRFKDAVHSFLRSPFVRSLGTNLGQLASDLWRLGWTEACKRAFESFDLAGEGHACEVLGLEPRCLESWSSVKRAYRGLALEYHPDKHAGASEDELASVEARFREITEAYEHLTKLHNSRKAEVQGQEASAAAE